MENYLLLLLFAAMLFHLPTLVEKCTEPVLIRTMVLDNQSARHIFRLPAGGRHVHLWR